MQSVDPPGASQLQGKLLDGDDSEGRGSGCYSRLHCMHSAEGGRSVGMPGSHMSDVPYWGHELSTLAVHPLFCWLYPLVKHLSSPCLSPHASAHACARY
eukprot:6195790-Pleurochrysis_carterae.AAC.3